MNKKGGLILFDEVIFLILNLVFLGLMLFFIFSNVGGQAVYEQAYAKQIALLIDGAKPGTIITLDLSDAFKLADKGFNKNNAVLINGNKIYFKLGGLSSYSYEFFSNSKIDYKIKGNNLVLTIS